MPTSAERMLEIAFYQLQAAPPSQVDPDGRRKGFGDIDRALVSVGRWGGTTWVVICSVLLGSVFLAGVAASAAAYAVILVLIGQQVLLAASSDGSSWSVPLADVACIGAVGGAISSTPFGLYAATMILFGRPIPAPGPIANALHTVVTGPTFATTAGAIGASILDLHDGSVLSVGKASEAGVLGYAVLLAAFSALYVAKSVVKSCCECHNTRLHSVRVV